LASRAAYGLDFNTNFTWQKELTQGVETSYNLFATIAPQVNDVFNRRTNRYLSGLSRPLVFRLAANYTTQDWFENKTLEWLTKDWTIGMVLGYSSGQPIRVPNANSLIGTQLGRSSGTFANRVPGEKLFTVDLNDRSAYDPTRTFVLNPRAWQDPAPGEWGVSAAYYNDYRYQRRPTEIMSLARNFRFREGRMNLMIRAEFTNIFNRLYYADPASASFTQTQTRAPDGSTTAGFGWINVLGVPPAGLGPRQGTLVGRFTF
jgi:hypothetical protein